MSEALNVNHSETATSDGNKQPRKINRRIFLYIAILFAVCFYLYNPFKPPAFKTKKKLVILGFDGTDPDLVNQWLDELPNLRHLKKNGGFQKLQSCYPPESPVAWSCFAVGGNPGRHGVFDFLRRPSGTYSPSVEAFVKRQYAEFMFKTIPVQMPKAIQRRGGTAFWDVLSDAGVRTTMIEVPVTFPPPKLSYGRSLSGLGVPDIRGQQATFHHFVYEEESDADRPNETTFGGKLVQLERNEDVYSGVIWGPNDPVIDDERHNKEAEKLELYLSWYEWQTHIYTKQGSHVSDEQKLSLSDSLNINVYGVMAYSGYLEDLSIEKRADRIREYIKNATPYVKEDGASTSEARENIARITKQLIKVKQEISQLSKPIKQKVTFKLLGNNQVEIAVGSDVQTVDLLKWSGWFTVYFPVMTLIKAQAICRFYPQELKPHSVKIYMTSPDIDPRNPILPVSHPKSYSQDLAEWLEQPYKTRGWAAETHALKDGQLEEDGFIEDLNFIMDLREKKLFETWDRTFNNVFISVFSATDRVAHMFYRMIDKGHPMHDTAKANKYKDTMKNIYKRMDTIVGKMLNKIENEPDTTLLVMSDHGFSSWRYQVHINTWLYKHGFLTIKGQLVDSNMKLDDLMKGQSDEFFEYVDWRNTKAYSLGLGQIYINLEGREPLGIVKPEDYQSVCDGIAEEMTKLRDHRDITPFKVIEDDPHKDLGGHPVVHFVKHRSEIWKGDYADDAHDCPDLQVGFYPGYRVSWQTCLGGISTGEVIEDNLETWSGDHCSLSPDYVPGMVFSNRQLQNNPSIYDFAPTVLEHFGLTKPTEMEGKNLLAGRQ